MSKYGIRLSDNNAVYPLYLIREEEDLDWPGYAHLIQEAEGYHKIYKTDSFEEAKIHMQKIYDFYKTIGIRYGDLEIHEFNIDDTFDLIRGRR